MKTKITLDRRQKYVLLSVLLVADLMWFSYAARLSLQQVFTGVLALVLASLGVMLIQYSLISSRDLRGLIVKTAVNTVTLPGALTLGTLFSLYYFPNLSVTVKTAAILAVGVFMYISMLVNNIFLVVYERGEVIPLFRVASTWSQILIVVVSIPLFAGVYKLPFLPFIQSGLVAITAFLFTMFLGWVQGMDPEVPSIDKKTKFIEGLLVGFILGALSISISFLPTESFLRALLMSSVLMFGVGYMQAHHKNVITKKLVVEYAVICIGFLALVLIFRQI